MVEAIAIVYDPQPMYNLTVVTPHTYFGRWLTTAACSDSVARVYHNLSVQCNIVGC